MERDTAVNQDQAELSFASKIDYLQPSGSYATTLQFNIVANPLVDYIQDFTAAMCQEKASSADYTVIDKRDNNDYTVRYINGNCWMTQNLRYIGDTGSTPGNMVMKTATSNIDADTSLNYYHFGDSQCTRTGATGLTNLCIETGTDSSGNSTAWYNYVAASAGSIAGELNSNNSTSSVCPAGWRLPAMAEMNVDQALFNPVHGGYYYCGMANVNNPSTWGNWWSSTAYDTTDRYYIYYTTSMSSPNYGDRYHGLYVRCIAK